MSVTFDIASLIVGGCRLESPEAPEAPEYPEYPETPDVPDVPDNPDNLDSLEPPSEGKVTNCKFGA